jgi:hypothetical protein
VRLCLKRRRTTPTTMGPVDDFLVVTVFIEADPPTVGEPGKDEDQEDEPESGFCVEVDPEREDIFARVETTVCIVQEPD